MRLFLLPLLGLSLLTVPAFAADEGSAPPDSKREGVEKKSQRAPGTPKKRDPESRPTHPERKGAEAQPFLGVATSYVSVDLREHLDLDEGFGIQVQQVLPDSPAAEASLRKHDVLVRFEDQRLISPEHLSLLVHTKSPGDTVTLTLIRKGQEKSIEATLGKADGLKLPPRPFPPYRPTPPGFDSANPEKWNEYMRKQQEHFRKFLRSRSPEPGENSPEPAPPGSVHPPVEGKPPAVSVRPGFPVRVFGTSGVVKIDNEEGEVTISEKDGEHHIIIHDAEGVVVYEGDYDASAGTGSLPEEARAHLRKMKLDDLEILLPKELPEIKKTAEPDPPDPEEDELL